MSYTEFELLALSKPSRVQHMLRVCVFGYFVSNLDKSLEVILRELLHCIHSASDSLFVYTIGAS